jgi:maltose alpha-D-glucosyltransferase/alpha-amylase
MATDLRDACVRLAKAGEGALATRIHGDFHLGQVLVAHGDAFIVDFEGEPALPLAQRRAKSSPLRDVAGLLRSFDYAAAAAAPGRAPSSDAAGERRLLLLRRFRETASREFLTAYRDAAQNAPNPWVSRGSEAALLELSLLQKAAYEIRYEAANRPEWIAIPLRGLIAVARRVLTPESAHA